LYYLAVYYSGAFHLLRWWRRLRGANRACVLLYHRVNDQGEDELTVGVERFAEHALVFGKHYDVIPTSLLVERLARGEKLPANTLAIHFDDCYRDVYQKASAILEQVRLPACSFISSGYLDTDRQFAHDAEKYPGRYENLRRLEVVALRRRGFEIGAHTVNHVDLGRCSLDEASTEVVRVKADLEEVVQERLTLFSYPFGRKDNIRPEVVAVVRRAGYQALFSAYGGYVTARSSLYDIPRIGVGGNFRPLDLLMEIEGWSLGALWRWWKHGVR
jgi:peptidoglycan/xylan/chitin deacetylase (PgdA/CDA1 family)